VKALKKKAIINKKAPFTLKVYWKVFLVSQQVKQQKQLKTVDKSIKQD
jgi:hypothetical protein